MAAHKRLLKRQRKSTGRLLSDVGEFGWLKTLLPRLFWPRSLNSRLILGAGDDAGAFTVAPGKTLVATTDAMVEGIHFERAWTSWDALGEKVLAMNLSDLAAMGRVKPLAALVTAAFPPKTPVDTVNAFYKGMEKCARRWSIGFLGGDTVGSKRDWFVSVTVLGEADSRGLLKRSTARPGDWIVTSGPLGLAAAGLEVLRKKKTALPWTRPLVNAFSRPQPRFAEAALLAGPRGATSLMDCSDGLEASVCLLAEASHVGADLYFSELPRTELVSRWAAWAKRPSEEYTLRGGEDYELVFTVRPSDWPRLRAKLPRAFVVGEIRKPGSGCWISSPGRRVPLHRYGYSHFQKA